MQSLTANEICCLRGGTPRGVTFSLVAAQPLNLGKGSVEQKQGRNGVRVPVSQNDDGGNSLLVRDYSSRGLDHLDLSAHFLKT